MTREKIIEQVVSYLNSQVSGGTGSIYQEPWRMDMLNIAPSGRTLLISDVPDASPTVSSHP